MAVETQGRIKFTEMPIKHCAEGRCQHPIRSRGFVCAEFVKLCKGGKNPTNCVYYNHTQDFNNFYNKNKDKKNT